MVFHLASWFVRYACLKQHMFVHNATSCKTTLNKYHRIHITYQRIYHISLERYFHNLKCFFHGFSFVFMVWKISSIEATYVYKNSVCTSPELQQKFSDSLGHHTKNMLYVWKGLFDISSSSSMQFNFIICIRIYEWICNKTSIAPKIMNFSIFWTFIKLYCNHGYGLTTQNP